MSRDKLDRDARVRSATALQATIQVVDHAEILPAMKFQGTIVIDLNYVARHAYYDLARTEMLRTN